MMSAENRFPLFGIMLLGEIEIRSLPAKRLLIGLNRLIERKSPGFEKMAYVLVEEIAHRPR
jgi:hypothetical protein